MASLRRLALLFFLLLPLVPERISAADPDSLPGFDAFEAGVTIDYLAAGQIDARSISTPYVIVERIEADAGASLPFANATQSIAVLDGRLAMIDDLGLPASLKAGKQTFAPKGAFARISASEPTSLLRARIVPPPVDITILDTLSLTRASGSTLIVRNEITLPPADAATFFMANVALAADGSLGKQSFTGSTVVSASNQPLWFKRPRRLTSTLADGASTVIPAGTQVTIENAGKEPASVLLVGVAPAAAATANDEGPAPTPSSGSTDRPVTRDDDDGLGSLVSIARSIHTGADSSRRVLL